MIFFRTQQQDADQIANLLRWEVRSALLVLGFVGLAVVGLQLSASYYADKVLPNTVVDTIAIGGLTQVEAIDALRQQRVAADAETITIYVDDIQISSDSGQVHIVDPYPDLVEQLLPQQTTGSFISRGIAAITHFLTPTTINTTPRFNPKQATQQIDALAALVNIAGEDPSAELGASGNAASIVIHPGKPGRAIDTTTTLERMNTALAKGEFVTQAMVASTSAPLNDIAQSAARERAARFVGSSIRVVHADGTITLSDKELVSLLALPNDFSDAALTKLLSGWETKYNRPPTSAVFVHDPNTMVVETFVPPRTGLELNAFKTREQLLAALTNIEANTATTAAITLEFTQTQPAVELAETNNLGITERIGVGNSEYHGSIPTRVHNVALTASRITNHIVRPGEEFSFNAALGEVSAKTGFKPAYVIRAGRTELGDGGGVCQVSSTLFRALLDSGLDITRRLQHSYRVGYYELNSDPGFDATVYSGNVDLRFKNDTKDHVLIHIENDQEARSMRVELYGTSDGRRTEVVDYQKWGGTGASAPEYILDPTLAPGQKIQIDWAVGGLKTKFTHRVYKADGELLRENTYYSNYRPWSAKYRVGVLP